MLKRKIKLIDSSSFQRLDQWLSPPVDDTEGIIQENLAQKSSIFIDLPDILKYFKIQEKILDYHKLMNRLKILYGADLNTYLYVGAFPERDLSVQDFKKQSKFFEDLSKIGYNLIKSNLFVRNSGKIVEKGSEVALAIDMIQHFHLKNDHQSDLDILFCANIEKYRKTLKIIRKKYNRKVKIYSLAQEYEDDLQNFKEFIDSVSKSTINNSQWNFQPNIRTYKRTPSDSVRLFTVPKTAQERLREKSQRLKEKSLENQEKKKTALYVDYGNLRHNLQDLKKFNGKYKGFKELDLLMLLKSKAESRNQLKKASIFMGVPLLDIKNLESMRKKNERLYESLREQGFEVYFSYNEVLFEGGMKETDVDMRISTDIACSLLDYDFGKYILVSGDADFVPVVRMLKSFGKDIEIWAFTDESLSPFLIEEITSPSKKNTKCLIKSITEMMN